MQISVQLVLELHFSCLLCANSCNTGGYDSNMVTKFQTLPTNATLSLLEDDVNIPDLYASNIKKKSKTNGSVAIQNCDSVRAKVL